MQRYPAVSLLAVVWVGLAVAPGNAHGVTITRSFNYGASAPCGTVLSCISFEFGLVGGACILSAKSIGGALPAGSIVTNVTVRVHGYRSGAGITVRPLIQGQEVDSQTDTLPDAPACSCEPVAECDYVDFFSATYPGGWPGWDYIEPDANLLELEVTGAEGGIAVDAVDVFITYRLCNNGVLETGETCDDGDADFCDGCTPACEPSPICNDDNICTSDACNPDSGECVFTEEACTIIDDGFETGDLSARLPTEEAGQ